MSPNIIAGLQLAIKIAVLIGMGVYIMFAAVIVRQEQLMANVLEERSEPVIRLITLLHLVAAISIFLLAVLVLP
ncbi:hypothetical protein A2Z33_07540 [Candidatus Gottesmanbacteria bacterium RBG_16_52_11]|uniref:Copper resistance protein D domain-containing protein n=1 Tax=Candidatus Gottesmanbacteria bacterium RBG_16_52_11 TaxID=1798374 RepID=A0A1F5YNJ9_9BACT|nr:MAG: hypothetical protein A2Z33_07540 [Candidatus Gottesmanbacteria bacterium RBG_16_52_11]